MVAISCRTAASSSMTRTWAVGVTRSAPAARQPALPDPFSSEAAGHNSTQKVDPTPTLLSTPMVPSMASTNVLLSDRPIPVPSTPRSAASSRSKGMNTRWIISVGIPSPVSVTTDAHPRRLRRAAGRCDPATVAVVLDGVGHEIDQDLLEPVVVGHAPPDAPLSPPVTVRWRVALRGLSSDRTSPTTGPTSTGRSFRSMARGAWVW